jgi:hypothetical protein
MKTNARKLILIATAIGCLKFLGFAAEPALDARLAGRWSARYGDGHETALELRVDGKATLLVTGAPERHGRWETTTAEPPALRVTLTNAPAMAFTGSLAADGSLRLRAAGSGDAELRLTRSPPDSSVR